MKSISLSVLEKNKGLVKSYYLDKFSSWLPNYILYFYKIIYSVLLFITGIVLGQCYLLFRLTWHCCYTNILGIYILVVTFCSYYCLSGNYGSLVYGSIHFLTLFFSVTHLGMLYHFSLMIGQNAWIYIHTLAKDISVKWI